MAANKLQMAHERRKLALRSVILGNRARVAQLQDQTKRAREELKSMTPKRSTNAGIPSLPVARVR